MGAADLGGFEVGALGTRKGRSGSGSGIMVDLWTVTLSHFFTSQTVSYVTRTRMTRARMSYNSCPSMIDTKSDSKTRLLVYRKTKNDKKRKRKVASNIGVGSFSLRGYLFPNKCTTP